MQDQAVGFRSEVGCKVMELIRKSDALHAVLHNSGQAAVAAVAAAVAQDRQPEAQSQVTLLHL